MSHYISLQFLVPDKRSRRRYDRSSSQNDRFHKIRFSKLCSIELDIIRTFHFTYHHQIPPTAKKTKSQTTIDPIIAQDRSDPRYPGVPSQDMIQARRIAVTIPIIITGVVRVTVIILPQELLFSLRHLVLDIVFS